MSCANNAVKNLGSRGFEIPRRSRSVGMTRTQGILFLISKGLTRFAYRNPRGINCAPA